MRQFIPILILIAGVQASADEPAFADLEQFLGRYCVDCHGSDTSKGEVNVETMLLERPLVRNGDGWLRIMDLIQAKEMPPPKKKKQVSMFSWVTD